MHARKRSDVVIDQAVIDWVRAKLELGPLYAPDGVRDEAERFAAKDFGDEWRAIHRHMPDMDP